MKRRLSLALALLLAAAQLSLGWAAASSRPAKTTAKPALVELGGLLKTSLPVLSGLSLPAGRKPAALDPRKGAALLKRADEILDARPSAAKFGDAEPAYAKLILRSVNSVLLDFKPEDIAKMPEDQLHAVAGIILDQTRSNPGTGRAEALRGVTVLAQTRTRRLLALRERPLKEILKNPGPRDERHGEMIEVSGVPETALLLRPHPEPPRTNGWRPAKPISKDSVFRHYTEPKFLPSILSSKRLWNGHMPYVQHVKHTFDKDFPDITGLFLTLPGAYRDGVTRPSQAYVDVLLPSRLPLMELEAGKVYLVPLPAQTIDWKLAYYLSWMDGGEVPRSEIQGIKEIDAEGGPGPHLSVPVKIVRHGRVR